MHKIRNAFTSSGARSFFQHAVNWVIGAAIGAIFGAIFTENYIWSIVFAVLLALVAFGYVMVSSKVNSKCDVVKIMQAELKAGNYKQVIRLGYPLSRPLHISYRDTLRKEIGLIIKQACENMSDEEEIQVQGDKLSVAYIKAKTLIDDLGWAVHKAGDSSTAQENITQGIEAALKIGDLTLAIKGYRHLIGVYTKMSNMCARDEALTKGKNLLESGTYKKSFSSVDKYNHHVAEFNYAYAQSLLSDQKLEEALKVAQEVQHVFSQDATVDMERYVKTFDLIGDIYAKYDNHDMLKLAKRTYYQGIIDCKTHNRAERLIRIAIDYINLLIKMMDKNVYGSETWENVDAEETGVYETALAQTKGTDNKSVILDLKRAHKHYLKRRR